MDGRIQGKTGSRGWSQPKNLRQTIENAGAHRANSLLNKLKLDHPARPPPKITLAAPFPPTPL
jgi:hypothetical protein